MSLKRKCTFDQLDSSSSTTSLCTDNRSPTASPLTTTKYIKTEQLLERTPSNHMLYNNNSPSNENHERK